MHRISPKRFATLLTAFAAIIVVTARCSDQGVAPRPLQTGAAWRHSTTGNPRIDGAKQNVYTGALHGAGLNEIYGNRAVKRRFLRARREQQCATVWAAVQKIWPDVERRGGKREVVLPLARNHMKSFGCQGRYELDAPASVYLNPSGALPAIQEGEELSDAVFPHFSQLQSSLAPLNTPWEAAAAANNVLSSASSLNATDFGALTEMANFGVSSIEYWYDYGQSGGFSGSGGGDGSDDLMSIFASTLQEHWIYKVGRIGGADLGGALMCVGVAWESGVKDPRILLAAGLICGLVSSAMALL